MKKITFTLNDEVRSLYVELNLTLLDMLRDRLGIKSPKCGCDSGDCGACTVIYNGRSVRSCLILAVEANGHTIKTLEGVSKGGLTPLQKAFHEKNAFQCGYCAPGIILSTTELLDKHPHPSELQIKEAIAGNLCRCTGYSPIIDTIVDFTKKD